MRLWKITPWLLLFTGLIWIFTVLRNLYVPNFLNFGNGPHEVSLAPLQLASGALCLLAGVGTLLRTRRGARPLK